MKLPTKAQTAEMNNVAGTNTSVATMTGLTNILKRYTCTYAAPALRNVRRVNNGTACRKTVYGSAERGISWGYLARKSRRMEKNTQRVTHASQSEVHIESWYLRLFRGV